MPSGEEEIEFSEEERRFLRRYSGDDMQVSPDFTDRLLAKAGLSPLQTGGGLEVIEKEFASAPVIPLPPVRKQRHIRKSLLAAAAVILVTLNAWGYYTYVKQKHILQETEERLADQTANLETKEHQNKKLTKSLHALEKKLKSISPSPDNKTPESDTKEAPSLAPDAEIPKSKKEELPKGFPNKDAAPNNISVFETLVAFLVHFYIEFDRCERWEVKVNENNIICRFKVYNTYKIDSQFSISGDTKIHKSGNSAHISHVYMNDEDYVIDINTNKIDITIPGDTSVLLELVFEDIGIEDIEHLQVETIFNENRKTWIESGRSTVK